MKVIYSLIHRLKMLTVQLLNTKFGFSDLSDTCLTWGLIVIVSDGTAGETADGGSADGGSKYEEITLCWALDSVL